MRRRIVVGNQDAIDVTANRAGMASETADEEQRVAHASQSGGRDGGRVRRPQGSQPFAPIGDRPYGMAAAPVVGALQPPHR